MTQEQLAFAADIDLTYVGGIERGKRNPSLLVLVRISEALNTEPAILLERKALRETDTK
jgi:transcriptional regulator with XRE-family HTH domain